MDVYVGSVNENRFAIEEDGVSYSEREIKDLIKNVIQDKLTSFGEVVKFYDVGKNDEICYGIKEEELFILNDFTHSNVEGNKTYVNGYGVTRPSMGGTTLLEHDGHVLAEYIGHYNGLHCNMIAIHFNLLLSYNVLSKLIRIIENYNTIITSAILESKVWSNKEVQNTLYENIKEAINASIERDKEVNKRKVNRSMSKIESLKQEMIDIYKNMEIAMRYTRADESAIKERSNRIFSDMELINKEDKIENILIEGSNISFITEPLKIYANNDKIYYGGKYTIDLNLNENDISITSDNKRRSCWSNNDPHPHISGRDGRACFGNLESTIIELLSQREYYALILSLIDFLETANVNDVAGEMVKNWDEVE